MHRHDRWRWLTVAAGAVVLLWTIGLAVTHAAWSVTFAGMRITSRDPLRSLIAGALLTSIGLAGLRLASPGARRLSAIAGVLALLVCLLGLQCGTFVAGGSDPLPEQPIPVGTKREIQSGDRIYLGAWTRIVVRPATQRVVDGSTSWPSVREVLNSSPACSQAVAAL